MFEIGTKVLTTEGQEHHLSNLVLDPSTLDVSDLVVALRGDDQERRVVSVVDVGHVDQNAVRLNITHDELTRRRPFSVQELEVPVGGVPGLPTKGGLLWADPYQGANTEFGPTHVPVARVQVTEGVGERQVVVGRDTPVFTAGGKHVGHVDHLSVDLATFVPHAVVVKLPGIRRRRVMVAAEDVASWERGGITLRLHREDLKALPPFAARVSDAEVETAVRAAIQRSPLEVRMLHATVDEGHVILRGHVHDADARRQVDTLVRGVRGVCCLTNELTTDRMLITRVQARLDDDAVASLYPVDIAVDDAVVTVRGAVPNTAIHHIVCDIVDHTPGVRQVVDELVERVDGQLPATPPAVAAPTRG